ncbi:nuclear transport factor 2 family protein [Dactylosporangium sp. CA-139066]|uniref:nuclear transport factor 2 family protein n=1 Tax=Dactylosporangium sp. CA-139066 TaxID=3239930 RepID=UPI003D8BF771
MSTLQELADRLDIAALPGEFTDAASSRDFERFAALFTDDGVWRIPGANVDFRGRAEIRAGIERLQVAWEFLIQNVHPGTLRVDGDTAFARVYVSELGRFRDGTSHVNYSVYHDRYRRTAEGWRFAERAYEVRYVDTAPLTGGPMSDTP